MPRHSIVIAIEAFHDNDAHSISDAALTRYLYGSQANAAWNREGTLEYQRESITSHKFAEKEIPSNFFSQPDTENVSAVMFTNSGTNGKFLRMGYQHGYGTDVVAMGRAGMWYDPEPTAKDPRYMIYNMDQPPFVESWGQGLVVCHNPNCKHPLPKDFIHGAVQYYINEHGELVSDCPEWHPMSSKTLTAYVGKLKTQMRGIPLLGEPRILIGSIPKQAFQMLCPSLPENNPFGEEQGWYIDETGSFAGVIVNCKSDNDWRGIVFARDKDFMFRFVDQVTDIATRKNAVLELQAMMMKYLNEPRRIFW